MMSDVDAALRLVQKGVDLLAEAGADEYAAHLAAQLRELGGHRNTRSGGVVVTTMLDRIKQLTQALEDTLCVCTQPCTHLSEASKVRARQALSTSPLKGGTK